MNIHIKFFRVIFITLIIILAENNYSQEISLNGELDFAIDSSASFDINNVNPKAEWSVAKVPLSWQAQFEGLRDYKGIAWYKKSINIDEQENSKTLARLQNGENVICIIDSNTSAPASFPFKILSRKSDWLDGNWASNFNWLRINKEPFNSFNFGKRLGFEIAETKPDYVISGIPSKYFSDVVAGMFVGWVHMNSGYIVQMKAGKGRLILCTLPLNSSADPYPIWLLEKLIEYVKSESFNPNLNWKL